MQKFDKVNAHIHANGNVKKYPFQVQKAPPHCAAAYTSAEIIKPKKRMIKPTR